MPFIRSVKSSSDSQYWRKKLISETRGKGGKRGKRGKDSTCICSQESGSFIVIPDLNS